ncbi:unnamed protein product [Urochloa humidicola]
MTWELLRPRFGSNTQIHLLRHGLLSRIVAGGALLGSPKQRQRIPRRRAGARFARPGGAGEARSRRPELVRGDCVMVAMAAAPPSGSRRPWR